MDLRGTAAFSASALASFLLCKTSFTRKESVDAGVGAALRG